MTLLAHAFPQLGIKPIRDDDRVVLACKTLIAFSQLNVQLSRTVTALTADRISLKYGSAKVIDRVINGLRPVGMAVNTFGPNRTSKVPVPGPITRSQVPHLGLSV